jgi:hypothetical protein
MIELMITYSLRFIQTWKHGINVITCSNPTSVKCLHQKGRIFKYMHYLRLLHLSGTKSLFFSSYFQLDMM